MIEQRNMANFMRQMEHIDLLLQQQVSLLPEDLHQSFSALLLPPNDLLKRIEEVTGSPNKDLRHLRADLVLECGTRLGDLVVSAGLTSIERDCFLLCLLPHIDGQYARLYAEIQGSNSLHRPNRDLLLFLLLEEDEVSKHSCFNTSSPLFDLALLRTDEPSSGLYIDDSVYHYLLGADDLPMDLTGFTHKLVAPSTSDIHPNVTRRLHCLMEQGNIITVIKGQEQCGRASAVSRAANLVGMSTMVADINIIPEGKQDAILQLLVREACIRNSSLIIRGGVEFSKKYPFVWSNFCQRVQRNNVQIFILTTHEESAPQVSGIPKVEIVMPAMTRLDKAVLLEESLLSFPADSNIDIDALVARFHISPARIHQTLNEGLLYRRQHDENAPLDEQSLRWALKLQTQQNFGELAQRIEPKRGLDDLVVSSSLMEHLKEVLMAIRHRDEAMKRGFSHKTGGVHGISALFHGDPGTGKTLSAEVLANELGVDLIKVDLSTVVNKYIGETEKNLSKIFDLAAMDSGVLFFDEADALFGKRSETKDAQDRHANIEVSYLLQRLENHSGLVVLSTNNRSHLDVAFTRRLTFILRFISPKEEERERLWRRIWPDDIPLSEDIDFDKLAKEHQLTGSNIRNIALKATWAALDDSPSGCVTQKHIHHAIKRELDKSGRLVF